MDNNSWDQFVQTGSIMDYLKYTACTSETSDRVDAIKNSEGRRSGDSYTNRDSTSNNAHRGL